MQHKFFLPVRAWAALALGSSTLVYQPARAQIGDTGAVALEEIIVTAQRREEDLQKAAAAITAITGDDLATQGVTQPEDLNKLVPGLAINTGGPNTRIYLRGVGSYGTNVFADPAVAFNIDGVYIGRITGLSGNFYDLQRVEVLKGPQGTLYGRNATGGAINLITNKPVDHFEAGAGVELGNYSEVKLNGFVNVPLSGSWALRAAGQSSKHDGYETAGDNDDDTVSGRLQMRYAPSQDFSLLLSGGYTKVGGKGAQQVPYTSTGFYDNSNPWVDQSIAAKAVLAPQFTNGVDFGDNKIDVKATSLLAQADANLGFSNLTVIAAYLDTKNNTKTHTPGFLVWNGDEAKQSSLETRLTGDSGPWRWIGGLFYYEEDQKSHLWVDQGNAFNQTGFQADKVNDSSFAAFGDLTYSITDRARVSGGLRYTTEKKELAGQIFNRQSPNPAFNCAVLGTTAVTISTVQAAVSYVPSNYPYTYCRDASTGSKTWNDVSWKLGFDYDLTDSSMVYLNVSRGFKAGGFFAAGNHAEVGNSYDPEHLLSYAVGSKNRFFDNRLQLNLEAFYWDYKNHQESFLSPFYRSVPSFGSLTQNGDGELYGLDADFNVLLTRHDELAVLVQYLHAEYTNFVYTLARPGELQTGAGTQPPVTVCPSHALGTGLYSVDCDGQQMPRSPQLQLTGQYEHTFEFANGMKLVPGASAKYSDSMWTAVDYNPLQKQKAVTIYGAYLSLKSRSDNWSATAFINNLSDETVFTDSFVHPSGVVFNGLAAPRTYGVRASVRW